MVQLQSNLLKFFQDYYHEDLNPIQLCMDIQHPIWLTLISVYPSRKMPIELLWEGQVTLHYTEK